MSSTVRRTEVAAAVVIQDERVLVQTRPPGRHYAGWWEFPGGKLEAGEDAEACAVRECREELELAVSPREHLHVEEWGYPGSAVRVTFIRCEVVPCEGDLHAPPAPRAVEGQTLLWADADDLRSLRFLPANARLLQLLIGRFAQA